MKITRVMVQNSPYNNKSKTTKASSPIAFGTLRSEGARVMEEPSFGLIRSLILLKKKKYPASRLFSRDEMANEGTMHYTQGLVSNQMPIWGHNINFEYARIYEKRIDSNKDVSAYRSIMNCELLTAERNVDFKGVYVGKGTNIEAITISHKSGKFNAESVSDNAVFQNVLIEDNADINTQRAVILNSGTKVKGKIRSGPLYTNKDAKHITLPETPIKGIIILKEGASTEKGSLITADKIILNGNFNSTAIGENIVVGENAKIGDDTTLKAKNIIFEKKNFLPENANIQAETVTFRMGSLGEITIKAQEDVPEEYTNIKIIPNILDGIITKELPNPKLL